MRHVHKSISALLTALLCVLMLIPQNGYAASNPTFTVDSISAKAGSAVTVDVSVKDNPGILGLTLTVNYDDGLTLVSGQSGEAFSPHTMTKPGKFVSGCNFVWDAQELSEAQIMDGTVLKLVFNVADDVAAGTDLGIRISCDATDTNLMAVDANTVNGKVNIISDTVENPDLESISAVLANNEFNAGDDLVIDGLEVIAEYSDGTTKVLSESDYTVDATAINTSVPGTYYLTISYTDNDITKTTTVPVKINAILTGITLKPSKTVYKAGEDLDLSGLTVMATYSGNQTKKVTTYQTNADDINMDIAGEKTVEVTYSENGIDVNASYKITVEPVLTGIEATKEKTDYLSGDELNVDDLTVVASYLGQDSKQVNGFDVDKESVDMNTPGEKTLTVTYTEGGVTKSTEVTINVGKALKSISAEKATTDYYLNEDIDLSDLVVTAKYSDGSEEVVEDYTTNFDSLDFSAVGTYKLVIEYAGKTAEININVTADISYIDASKTKTTYLVGDELNVDDITVTAHFQDGSTAVVNDFSTDADKIDMSTAGAKMMVVIYNHGTTSTSTAIQIIVIEPSHADDQEKADEVSEIIANVDDRNWESVESARAAYNALTDDQKQLVTNLSELEAAEEKIASTTTDLNTLEFDDLYTYEWDGIECWPCYMSVYLKTAPYELEEKVDYVAEYLNNVEVGTGTAILKGRGKYRGTKTLTFKILPVDMSKFADDLRLSVSSFVYDGAAKAPGLVETANSLYYAPDFTVADYTVTSATDRKSVGKHTVTYKFKGNYTGSLSYSITINPRGTTLGKLKAGKKSFTAKWKAQKVQTTGYEIQYALNSKFTKSAKIKAVPKNATVKKVIKKLKAKKKYYVRIRTYKTVNGVKYYSAWSKAKTVKAK